MSGLARPLRPHVCGGWYHITTRGLGRQAVTRLEQRRPTDKKLQRAAACARRVARRNEGECVKVSCLNTTPMAQAVESEVGAKWLNFGGQRGDPRRDLVLYIGRMQGGMTLAELAQHADMSLNTVAKAVRRMQTRLAQDRPPHKQYLHVLRVLAGEERES